MLLSIPIRFDAADMPSVFLSKADAVVESVTLSSARLADRVSEDCFKAVANCTSALVSCACVLESDSRMVGAEGVGASRVAEFDDMGWAVVSNAGGEEGSRRERRRVDVVRPLDTENSFRRPSGSGAEEAGEWDIDARTFSPRRSSSSVESEEIVLSYFCSS